MLVQGKRRNRGSAIREIIILCYKILSGMKLPHICVYIRKCNSSLYHSCSRIKENYRIFVLLEMCSHVFQFWSKYQFNFEMVCGNHRGLNTMS